jgi:hypothetical protein
VVAKPRSCLDWYLSKLSQKEDVALAQLNKHAMREGQERCSEERGKSHIESVVSLLV